MAPAGRSLDNSVMAGKQRESFRAGFRAGIPYAIAACLLAVSFGVLAKPVLGAGATIAMSVLLFAGSAQFAATAVLAAGGGAAAAIIAGILLNARYVPMGVALAPSLRGGPVRRALVGQGLIDFSWAAATDADGRVDPVFMLGATLPSYPCWVVGTVIGVLAGGAIGDPQALGLDAIFPTFFLALLIEGELHRGRSLVAALLGGAIAACLIPITPAGVPIIVASAASLIGLQGSGSEEREAPSPRARAREEVP
jgi:4-azaleucine resistance transporter AzlC